MSRPIIFSEEATTDKESRDLLCSLFLFLRIIKRFYLQSQSIEKHVLFLEIEVRSGTPFTKTCNPSGFSFISIFSISVSSVFSFTIPKKLRKKQRVYSPSSLLLQGCFRSFPPFSVLSCSAVSLLFHFIRKASLL